MSTVLHPCLISGPSRPPPSQRLPHRLASFTELPNSPARIQAEKQGWTYHFGDLLPTVQARNESSGSLGVLTGYPGDKQHTQSQCPRVTGVGWPAVPSYPLAPSSYALKERFRNLGIAEAMAQLSVCRARLGGGCLPALAQLPSPEGPSPGLALLHHLLE